MNESASNAELIIIIISKIFYYYHFFSLRKVFHLENNLCKSYNLIHP